MYICLLTSINRSVSTIAFEKCMTSACPWKRWHKYFLKNRLEAILYSTSSQTKPTKNDKHHWNFYLFLSTDMWVFGTYIPVFQVKKVFTKKGDRISFYFLIILNFLPLLKKKKVFLLKEARSMGKYWSRLITTVNDCFPIWAGILKIHEYPYPLVM